MTSRTIITGTGRAGTTFLVQLLTRLGLDTGFNADSDKGYFPKARAGLEWHLNRPDLPEILKGPHFCEQIDEMLARGMDIRHVIVPIRDLADAARSRVLVQQETTAPEGGSVRLVAGGLWGTTNPEDQEAALRQKLATLMEAVARNDLPLTVVSFPRLAKDADYLFAKLSPIFPSIEPNAFHKAFAATARPELIHDFTTRSAAPKGTNMPDAPSYVAKHKAIILEALKHPYLSVSSKDAIRTGNAYQAIDLGDVATTGGRPHREVFVRHLNLAGKNVLDIGANLGEISRLARRQGAALVDGYEYDPFFVETGRFINAATGTTRVSLFQGDATDPHLYDGMKYDVVLGFSVYVYIQNVLREIAAITDTLVIETHTLDHGLELYTNKISPHFPAWRILGFPDQRNDRRKSRAIVVFGKTQQHVDAALRVGTLAPENYFPNGFFEKNGLAAEGQLHTYAADVAERGSEAPLTGLGTAYFTSLLAGYADYRAAGRVLTDDNTFLRQYVGAIRDGRIAPDLVKLLDKPDQVKAKVEGKFRDLDAADRGDWHLIPPVLVTVDDEGKKPFRTTDGKTMNGYNIDGHHRFFFHQLFGRPVPFLSRERPPEKEQVKMAYSLAEVKT